MVLSNWGSWLACYFIAMMARVTSGHGDFNCSDTVVADWDLDPCFCDSWPAGIILDCSNVTSGDQLLTIPGLQNGESMPFLRIELSNNDQIEEIPDGAFGNHYAIESYDLALNTNLKRIGLGVISQKSAPTLVDIVTEGCDSLESFPFQDIKNFENLFSIYMIYNNLQEIPAEAFANSNTSLQILDLHGNNISSVGADAFIGLRNFETLHLGRNGLTEISGNWFKFASRPNSVGLSYNNITRLEEGEYMNFPLFTSLAYNEIETLEQSPWEGILEQLLGSEGYIGLEGNPIVCDCLVEWLYRRREFMPHLRSVLCQDLQGHSTPLWDLEEEFFDSC